MHAHTDFPNSVEECQELCAAHTQEHTLLLDQVRCTRQLGESVLQMIERTTLLAVDDVNNRKEPQLSGANKLSLLTPSIRLHYMSVFKYVLLSRLKICHYNSLQFTRTGSLYIGELLDVGQRS